MIKKIHIDLTKGEKYACELYSRFLNAAKLIGFYNDSTDKLISIFDNIPSRSYIEYEDIPVLKSFMNDISLINEAFFYEYDDTVEEKMLEVINKINKEAKHD